MYYKPFWIRSTLLLWGLMVSASVLHILAGRIYAVDDAYKKMKTVAVDRLPALDICLPYTLSDSGVVLEAMCLYDGPFQEDGSHDEVFSVGALILKNTSNQIIRSIEVKLGRGAETYIFRGEMIPPQSRVLIPERNRQTVLYTNFEQCAYSLNIASDPLDTVRIMTEEPDRIFLTNEADKKVLQVIMYHKTYLPEEDLYIGGWAYITYIPVIYSGQTLEIRPEYYITSNSRIIGLFNSE